MAILPELAAFVRALPLRPGFSVCEFGDQQISSRGRPMVASEFYRALGCGRYESIDGNGLGTVTADLNEPLDAFELGAFDLVTDFGTGEHIFDQAQVWRTMHALTNPGGFLVFDRPHQGYGKHCFYLTNPCLFTDLAHANAYTVLRLEKKETPRGWLVRGVFQRPVDAKPFRNPQQGRYRPTLRVSAELEC
jgi:hypothetical protein